MSIERTFSMIKPDAVSRNLSGEIISMIEKSGFKVIAQRMTKIHITQAKEFYNVHKEKPFYNDLCALMASGPIIVMVLKKENAISDFRKLMGATNPANADEGTIRKKYAISIDQNSIHGADSLENAQREIAFFFREIEIIND